MEVVGITDGVNETEGEVVAIRGEVLHVAPKSLEKYKLPTAGAAAWRRPVLSVLI
jgi:hypothetical protein